MANKKTAIQARYDSSNTRHFHLKYNLKTDADILAHLDKQTSIQGYIKSLIRADIAANGGAQEEEEQWPSSED